MNPVAMTTAITSVYGTYSHYLTVDCVSQPYTLAEGTFCKLAKQHFQPLWAKEGNQLVLKTWWIALLGSMYQVDTPDMQQQWEDMYPFAYSSDMTGFCQGALEAIHFANLGVLFRLASPVWPNIMFKVVMDNNKGSITGLGLLGFSIETWPQQLAALWFLYPYR